jgi:hypothetical protein
MSYADRASKIDTNLSDRVAQRVQRARAAPAAGESALPPAPDAPVTEASTPPPFQAHLEAIVPAPRQPARKLTTSRHGIDFDESVWDLIEDAVHLLKKKKVKTGAKVGPSLIVGAALEPLLLQLREDPDGFADRLRRYAHGRHDRP